MNINIALMLFLLVIIIYAVIIGVFSVILRITGIPRLKARFQVVSLLTNSGYTTTESEIMLLSPFRRKMCTVIMLFGYIFSATIISVIVNLAMTIPESKLHDIGTDTVIMSAVFAAAIITFNLKPIKRAFEKGIEKWCLKKLESENMNGISVLDNLGGSVIARVYVKYVPEEIKGVPVKDLNEKDGWGFTVMFLNRGEQEKSTFDDGEVLNEGDLIALHGSLKAITDVFFKDAVKKEAIKKRMA